MMDDCKRCLLLESAQEDTHRSVQEHIEKIPARQRAGEAEYQRRLACCRRCDHLLSGTCMKCGCYVELRAAFANQKCPNTKARKW